MVTQLAVRPQSPITNEPVAEESEIEAALKEMGVPYRYLEARFETFEPRKGAELALAQAHNWSLVLSGPPGTGKTHLAVANLAEYASHNIARAKAYGEYHGIWWKTRFCNVPRLLERLRRQVRDEEDHDLLAEYIEADRLVLDDMGAEKFSDWTSDRLSLLIGARYDNGDDTIVTTNFTLDELADRGYDRIVSRLCQDGPYVRIEASDYRLEIQP